jgi:hypothetical protein
MPRYNPNKEAIDTLNANLERIADALERIAAQPTNYPLPMWPNTYPANPDPITPWQPGTRSPVVTCIGAIKDNATTIVGDPPGSLDGVGTSITTMPTGYWVDSPNGRVWYEIQTTPTIARNGFLQVMH